MIGTELNHYKILEELGRGGMGEVYLAEDTKLGRQVALKVLPADLASDPERLERFQREARAVAALNHPNIVVLHSVEESRGTHFLTMELVEGRPLSELVPADGLPLEDLLRHGIALADALTAAHDRGIVHRDLKPSNVMVNTEGRVKVLDFGLAKLTEPPGGEEDVTQLQTASLTGEGKILGTVAHMAPEQAEGKPVDQRADVFALGTILYQMATGERPFQGDSAVSVLSSIMKDEPLAVHEVRPALPRHLGRIVSRCLEKDPERRYPSAKDLRYELRRLEREVASGQSSGATSVAAVESSPGQTDPFGTSDPGDGRTTGSTKRPTKHSTKRLGIALATIVLVAFALLYFVRRDESTAPGAVGPTALYSFATADSTSGTYYPLGRGLAELVERQRPGVAIEVLPSAGSFENARLMDRGEASIAFMQSDVAFHSVKTDRVLGHRSTEIVGLAALYKEYCHILIREDAGIRSLDDLPGHRVSLNLADSGSRFTNDVLLQHFGIELDENETLYLGTNDASIELLAGDLDASMQWFAAPHADILGVLRSDRVRLLSIDSELARGLQAAQPFLLPGRIPAGTYPKQTQPVDTFVVKALLVGRRSLPDDFVTGVLDALFGGISDLIAAHPRAAEISPTTAFDLVDGMSIPLHPAAERYRQERAR